VSDGLGFTPTTGAKVVLAPGRRLGSYEIVALIGAGAMGEVYRAHDTTLGRDVALKVVSGSLSTRPSAQERFQRTIFDDIHFPVSANDIPASIE